MHHLVGDHTLVAERRDRAALSVQQLAGEALVGERAVLDLLRSVAVLLGLEAALAVVEQRAHAVTVSSRVQSSDGEPVEPSRAASTAVTRAWSSSRSSAPSSQKPARSITSGRVRPWTTRVKRITAKARKMIRSRSGNGAPESIVSGARARPPARPSRASRSRRSPPGSGSRAAARAAAGRRSSARITKGDGVQPEEADPMTVKQTGPRRGPGRRPSGRQGRRGRRGAGGRRGRRGSR